MKPFEQQTYYELLEIPVSAPEGEIRAAYARALETYSPDSVAVYMLVDPGQVDALRARLTEAMEILTEPDLRAEYDRMIGVSRADASAVKALAPALAAAAQAVESQAPSKAPAEPEPVSTPAPEPQTAAAPSEPVAASEPAPAPKAPSAPVPEATPPAETPAPAAAATPAAPEPVPAPTPAAAEPADAPTPAMPAPLVVPGLVTPSQIHAAFRSYSISYVPVLVPAPSLTSTALASPFSAPGQVDAPPSGAEAPREAKAPEAAAPSAPAVAPAPEAAPAQAPVPAAEPVSPTASTPASTAGGASQGASTPAPAPPEPVRPPELAAEPAPPRQPTHVVVHHEEDELSGVRAPLPSGGEARAAASQPAGTPPAQRDRLPRPVPTPPPLPSGGRRVTRGPGPQPVVPTADAGKGSARPGHTPGMDLEEAQQLAQESAIATAEAALAQVAAKAREPRPKPVELPPNAEFNGEVLRQVRENRGLSLSQLAERTRISSKHLENVEADRYSALPATVYLRGILMNIARELGLDPLKVSRSYLTLAAGPKKK
jgi:hypothetical protein